MYDQINDNGPRQLIAKNATEFQLSYALLSNGSHRSLICPFLPQKIDTNTSPHHTDNPKTPKLKSPKKRYIRKQIPKNLNEHRHGACSPENASLKVLGVCWIWLGAWSVQFCWDFVRCTCHSSCLVPGCFLFSSPWFDLTFARTCGGIGQCVVLWL